MSQKYIRDGRAPIPKKEVTSKVMSSIRAKNTKPELILRKSLVDSGLSGYRLHWKKAAGKPDISYPGIKLAIFVHGCFWHRCPYCNPPFPKSHKRFWKQKFKKNIERDIRKKHDLENNGWKVVIIWECQIKNNLRNCVSAIKETKLKC